MTRVKIESGKESVRCFIFSLQLRNTWGSSSHTIPSFQDRLSSQPTTCSKTWKPCPSLNVAAKNKEEGVDSHPKSCLLLVLQKLSSPEAGQEGCQGDLKYRFATILNKSAPRAQRGEGVSHSKPSVAQILKWGKEKKKEQRKVSLRNMQAEEFPEEMLPDGSFS